MFKSVQTSRVSQAVIDQIRDVIFQKKLVPGDKLPSERQLIEQFRTSRVTIREALRTLEYAGMIEIRRGAEGGAFVVGPNTKFFNNFLQDLYSLGKIRISELTEARLALEPFSVRVAVERITEDLLARIMTNIQGTKECLNEANLSDARLLNLEFHRLIAHASQNPVIFFMIDSIMDIMENNIASIPLSVKPIERTLRYHEKICLAIKNRDSKISQDIMLKHIQDIQTALEA